MQTNNAGALLLGLVVGALATWLFMRVSFQARVFELQERHEEDLDRVSVNTALRVESLQRSTSLADAPENAWQRLDRMRSAIPDRTILTLPRTRTYVPPRLQGGTSS